MTGERLRPDEGHRNPARRQTVVQEHRKSLHARLPVGDIVADEEHPERPQATNVEFYSAGVLQAIGLPKDLFPPTFACARVAGWSAHVLEQASHNRLIRPQSEYIGPEPRKPVPLAERG